MKKIFPLFLIVLTAFCGCDGYMHYLPEYEKPKFHVGDTFYYYSEQTHLTDTLWVDYLHYGLSPHDADDYETVCYGCYIKTNKPVKNLIQFDYSYWPDDGFRLFSCASDSSSMVYSLFMQGDDGIKIGGRVYDYELILPKDTICGNVELLPNSIFISFTYGIIGYTYSDSTTYIITNPIK